MVSPFHGWTHHERLLMFRFSARSLRWAAIAVVVIAGCTTVPATSFGVTLPGYATSINMGTVLNVRLDGTTAADAGSYHSKISTGGSIIIEDAGDFTLTAVPEPFYVRNIDTAGLGPGEYILYVYKDTYTGEGSDNDVPVAQVPFTITSEYSY